MQYEMTPNEPRNYELQGTKQVMCAVVLSSIGNYNACLHHSYIESPPTV